MAFQRISQLAGRGVCSRGGADQQPGSRIGVVHLGQCSLLPLDSQQPLVQHPILMFVLGDPGADLQPAHRKQDRPVLVEHIEVGLDHGGVGSGHPRVAVVGVAAKTVGA